MKRQRLNTFFALLTMLFLTALVPDIAAASIAYVQGASQDPQPPQTSVSVTFPNAQAAGDLNVVIVGWVNSSVPVSSVTDSNGNVYIPAIGPTTSSEGNGAQTIYYAKNITAAAANANTVTVTFGADVINVDLRIAEYSGVDTASPFDTGAGAAAFGVSADSGPLTASLADELLVAASFVEHSTTGPGTGFTQRMITFDSDIVEDEIASGAGTYDGTAPQNVADWWIMQTVAFKPAGSTASDTQAPTAPGGLSASAISTTQIGLTWTVSTDNTGVTGYRIERCLGTGCTGFAEIADPTANSFVDAALTPATGYTYRVRATDAYGNLSVYSGAASATTYVAPDIAYQQSSSSDPQSPTPTSTVSATFSGAQTAGDLNVVIVGWNDSTSQITSVSDTAGNFYALVSSPTTSSGNATQAIYYAKNIVASSAGSNVVTVTLNAAVSYPDLRIVEYSGVDVIAPLDGFAGAAGSGISMDSGPLTTANAADLLVASNYLAHSTTGPGAAFTQRMITTDSDIVEDQLTGAVGTFDGTAPQNVSDWWIMQMVAFKGSTSGGTDTQPPTDPSGLTATVASSSEVDLSWSASTDNVAVTGYLLERCQGASCTTFAQIATPSTTSYSDTGLSASTSYTYRVRATDAAANLSGYSGTAATVTSSEGGAGGGGDTQPPSAPTELSAAAISSSEISLTWAASTDNVGVTGYLIERCSGATCTNFAQIATSTGTGFTDSGLTSSTAYNYRVRATDAAANLSDYSNTSSAATGSGSSGSAPATSTYTYDTQGRLQTVTTSGGTTTQYSYDAAGHVVSIQTH